MNLSQRMLVIFWVNIVSVGCDQSSKQLASEYLARNQMHSYFYDVIRVGYTENIGAFLGLGNNLSAELRFWVFSAGVGAVLLAFLCYMLFNSKLNLTYLTGLSLVFSGGISNFYDRIVNDGAVIDFLNIGLGSLRTGVFNLADMSIMLGAGIVIFLELKVKNSQSV